MAMMNTRLQVRIEVHGRGNGVTSWGGISEGEEWEGNVWGRVRVSVGRDGSSIWSSVGLVPKYQSTWYFIPFVPYPVEIQARRLDPVSLTQAQDSVTVFPTLSRIDAILSKYIHRVRYSSSKTNKLY